MRIRRTAINIKNCRVADATPHRIRAIGKALLHTEYAPLGRVPPRIGDALLAAYPARFWFVIATFPCLFVVSDDVNQFKTRHVSIEL